MDCKTARMLLDFARPGSADLEPADRAELEGHLADCLDCAALARTDRRADESLGLAVRAIPVPDGLRDRILLRLASQRDRWYQGRLARLTAAVAAALLLSWGAWAWLQRPTAAVDLDAFAEAANLLPGSLEEVNESIRGPIPSRAPEQFNYALLAHVGQAEFQGRAVPVLQFRRGDADAWVYILDARHFNLATIDLRRRGSGRAVQAFLSPDHQFAYVVVYRGALLEAFLLGNPPPAA